MSQSKEEITQLLFKKMIALFEKMDSKMETVTKNSEILLEIQKQREIIIEQLGEILGTSMAMTKTAEDTLSLVETKIQQLFSTESLHSPSTDGLWTHGQKILLDRIVQLVSIDLGRPQAYCFHIINSWTLKNYGSGRGIDAQTDRYERDKIGLGLITEIKKYGISDELELVLFAYFDIFFVAMTSTNIDYVDGIFLKLREGLTKYKLMRQNKPVPKP